MLITFDFQFYKKHFYDCKGLNFISEAGKEFSIYYLMSRMPRFLNKIKNKLLCISSGRELAFLCCMPL